MAEPSTTQAILVGIERYADSNAIPDLNGPVNDVHRFCQWLRYRNVPPENISVFASPLDRNTGIVDEITSLINGKPLEATKDIINKALREEARKKKASLFFLFWSGHGWIVPQGDRRLIYADATIEDLKNLNLTAQLNAMRTDLYKNLPQQLLIFDACANSQLLKITPPDDLPPIGKHLASQQQMVMLAANPGEYAINKGDEQTGIFSRELLNELKSLKDTEIWPPDLESVMQSVQRKFIKLREDKHTRQTPSYLLYQDWSGNIKSAFEPSQIEPRKVELTKLEKVILLRDSFLMCRSILDPHKRKHIILNLRPEITNNSTLDGDNNTVVQSVIENSLDYQNGLLELLKTTKYLFERDSIQMNKLWKLAQELFPEEVAE